MTAPFECEVRFGIDDIAAFHRRLAGLGARVALDYAFTDHYYRPAHAPWDPRERALRIREHHAPPLEAEVLLTHVEIARAGGVPFKRSRFAEGKVRLYAGGVRDCRAVVESLGFVPWIAVRKHDGRLFEIPGLGGLITERIDGVGWMAEVEEAGADPTAAAEAIRATLERLGVAPDAVTADPVAAIVARGRAEAHGA